MTKPTDAAMNVKKIGRCNECGGELEVPAGQKTTRGLKLCITCLGSRLRRKPNDEAFEVEWCYDLPKIEGTNDADIDAAKYRKAYLKTKPEAIAMAKRKLTEDKFGAVRVTPVRWEDQHPGSRYSGLEYRWEAIGDTIEVSD